MSNYLKAKLINLALNQCLRALGGKSVQLYFAQPNDNIAALAKSNTIYQINQKSVTSTYYYSEPGNPLLSSEYRSLAAFIYSQVRACVRQTSVLLAGHLPYHPEKAPAPLKPYIDNILKRAEKDKSVLMMAGFEIEPYIASLQLNKIDRLLKSTFFKWLDQWVFSTKLVAIDEMSDQLIGRWQGGDWLERTYEGQTFTEMAKNGHGEKQLTVFTYEPLYAVSNLLAIKTQTNSTPVESPLALVERLIFSPDGSTFQLHKSVVPESFTKIS